MTRQKQKDTEERVLEIFQNHYYDNVIFSCSESPDFISVKNNLGVEIVEYHGLNLKRQIEVKINDHINKAKSIYNENNKLYVSVYLTINAKFIKSISNCKHEYFENNFSVDLAAFVELMTKESATEMISSDIKEFNLSLSKIINWISVGVSENNNDHWQMAHANYLDIDRDILGKIIRKKEEKLIGYSERPEINKFILLIYTISAPVIGLSKSDSWSSSAGSLKLTGDIEKINSSFHEVYVVDLNDNMALQINA